MTAAGLGGVVGGQNLAKRNVCCSKVWRGEINVGRNTHNSQLNRTPQKLDQTAAQEPCSVNCTAELELLHVLLEESKGNVEN